MGLQIYKDRNHRRKHHPPCIITPYCGIFTRISQAVALRMRTPSCWRHDDARVEDMMHYGLNPEGVIDHKRAVSALPMACSTLGLSGERRLPRLDIDCDSYADPNTKQSSNCRAWVIKSPVLAHIRHAADTIFAPR